MNDLTFMREALAEARQGYEEGEVPVGAVIVKDSKIIGRAHNEREKRKDPLGHAELIAIKKASAAVSDWRLDGCTIYVTLEPCPMCAGAILELRMKRLVYGACDEKYGSAGTVMNIVDYPGMRKSVEVRPGVMAEECSGILKEFFEHRRNQVQSK